MLDHIDDLPQKVRLVTAPLGYLLTAEELQQVADAVRDKRGDFEKNVMAAIEQLGIEKQEKAG